MNDTSAVVLFEHSNTKLLIAGDNEESSWRALLETVPSSKQSGHLMFPLRHTAEGRVDSTHRCSRLFTRRSQSSQTVRCRTRAPLSVTVTSGWKVRARSSLERRKCIALGSVPCYLVHIIDIMCVTGSGLGTGGSDPFSPTTIPIILIHLQSP